MTSPSGRLTGDMLCTYLFSSNFLKWTHYLFNEVSMIWKVLKKNSYCKPGNFLDSTIWCQKNSLYLVKCHKLWCIEKIPFINIWKKWKPVIAISMNKGSMVKSTISLTAFHSHFLVQSQSCSVKHY